MKRIRIVAVFIFILVLNNLTGQVKQAGPHDFGKMWTFENPPKEWFQTTYNFNADDAWFDDVRKSSLRFASWCSGSFVSPNGLIMTNHHCSRGVTFRVEQEGEDFTKNGFYAPTHGEERKVEGLFVEQLIQATEITGEINKMKKSQDGTLTEEQIIEKIKEKYSAKKEWKNLRIQVVGYYSGAKYSLYGYKRFEDIRLVLVPEVKIGFFGGEEDNFTYPRYNLDFTFWRAYDEDGKPVDSSSNYFKFNANGPQENEAVFVIGNPARTERYKTMAQLEFDREYNFPMILEFYQNRQEIMKRNYEKDPDPNLMNQIFGLGNSIKVYKGILGGLNNQSLLKRKMDMENLIQLEVGDHANWHNIEVVLEELKPHAWAMNLLGPSPLRGSSFMLMHSLAKYEKQMIIEADESELNATRDEIESLCKNTGTSSDKEYLQLSIEEFQQFIPAGDKLIEDLLQGKTIEKYVERLFKKSKFYDKEKRQKLLSLNARKFSKKKDPLLEASRTFVSVYEEAAKVYQDNNQKLADFQKSIAGQAFSVFGESLPPDATFTLRISDGIVKSYEYNGTKAPFQTTFFGLYDRFYSHNGASSWELPEKWKNPDMEMLKIPMNFVSTNDIIGGNSGSPVINKEKELVGLIFDGNIESLPGNFIFDDEYNRAVSVHAGGMLAAIKYIYKAERLNKELLGVE